MDANRLHCHGFVAKRAAQARTRKPAALWFPLILLTCVFGADVSTLAQQKQVLVVYSTRRDAQVAILGDRALPQTLEKGLGESVDFYSEYIDLSRFPDTRYEEAFSNFLRVKYTGQRLDLVIAMQDVAVDFLAHRRDELFPGTPLVYVATSAEAPKVENATGLINDLELAGTLSLATTLQPETREVFVVVGADRRDEVYENQARAQFGPFESRLTISYLKGLPTRDLEARLARLPPHSVVYYLVVNRDGAGEMFHPLEYLDRLTAFANAPIYCWVDSAIGRGVVGGSLKSLTAQTEAVGQLALRVLRGEPADSIRPFAPNLNVEQLDWRQLRRWGISESRVPAGALLLFKEPSAWDRYKVYILGAAAVLVAQTLLIAGLLVQRRRRHEAEEDARGNWQALERSYDRIRDLGSRLLHAQDSERSHIARELHDDISQQVALLSIDLELLSSSVPRESEALADEVLNRSHGIARSVHDLSHRLYPAKLRLMGLVPSLQALQRELSRSDSAILLTHENVPGNLPPNLTLSLYRIVQEALQNALKYSKARRIAVHLRGSSTGLILTVTDDGIGFDVSASVGKGLGLIGMGERIEAVGGTLDINSAPGAGTTLTIAVPVAAVEAVEPAAADASRQIVA
jgi:signal transduction histidine kinase